MSTLSVNAAILGRNIGNCLVKEVRRDSNLAVLFLRIYRFCHENPFLKPSTQVSGHEEQEALLKGCARDGALVQPL